jgi:hypothetical protein
MISVALVQYSTLLNNIIKQRGWMDLYVLQPADKPGDVNDREAQRPNVDVIQDVDDFLTLLTTKVGTKLIRNLRIGGHGNAGGFQLGSTWISRREIKCTVDLRGKLEKLKEKLLPGFSRITIDACKCAQGAALLIEMAKLWNVPVTGFYELQGTEPLDQPTAGEGSASTCYPNGDCTISLSEGGTEFARPQSHAAGIPVCK